MIQILLSARKSNNMKQLKLNAQAAAQAEKQCNEITECFEIKHIMISGLIALVNLLVLS